MLEDFEIHFHEIAQDIADLAKQIFFFDWNSVLATEEGYF